MRYLPISFLPEMAEVMQPFHFPLRQQLQGVDNSNVSNVHALLAYFISPRDGGGYAAVSFSPETAITRRLFLYMVQGMVQTRENT